MSNSGGIARVKDIVDRMEDWAPAWTAEPWDRVGLLAGDPGAEVSKIWVALELCPELLEEALAQSVSMLLMHHPPLFKPIEALRMDHAGTARLVMAASKGLALFAAHTNLDSAPGGVNDALARRLGLVETTPLMPAAGGGLAKLVTFVPPDHLEKISGVLFGAGAGRVGDYTDCAFRSSGMGTFRAPKESSPYVGSPGETHTEPEERLETVVPRSRAGAVLKALLEAHPYQEPAVDLYPLELSPRGFGLGRVGKLIEPRGGSEFIAWAAQELGAAGAQSTGPIPANLERVAVVGGSGGDLLGLAAGAGAQMLITGEARYHAAEEALDLGICLVTLGHFQTEVVVVEPWARRMSKQLADYRCEVQPWTGGGDPWLSVQTQ